MDPSTYFLIVVPALAALAAIIVGVLKLKGEKVTAFLHIALVFISLFLIIVVVVSSVLLFSDIASRSNSTEELSKLSKQDETEYESNGSTHSNIENETNISSLSISEDMPFSGSDDSTDNELPTNEHENADVSLTESEHGQPSTSAEVPTNEYAINAFNAWVDNRATEDDMVEIVSYILAQIDISDCIEYGFVNEQFDDLNRFFYAGSFESEFWTLDELVLRIEDVIVTNQTYNNGSVYNLSFDLNNGYRLRLSMKYKSS